MLLIEGSDDDPPTHALGAVEAFNSDNEGTRLADYPHNKSVTAGYWDPRGRNIGQYLLRRQTSLFVHSLFIALDWLMRS